MTLYQLHLAAGIMETRVAVDVCSPQNNLQHRAYVCDQQLVSPDFLGLVSHKAVV